MNYRKFKKFIPPFMKRFTTRILIIGLASRKLGLKGIFSYLVCLGTISDKQSDVDKYYSIEVANNRCVWLRDNRTDLEIFEQIFLLEDCKLESSLVPEVIIDAGAHIGCTAIYFSLRYPAARIICLEASVKNFAQLRKNTEDLSNVEILNAALWHEMAEVQITNPSDEGWSFRFKADDLASANDRIQAVTVGHLIESFKIDRIGILKLDIEGAEKSLFSAPSSKEWMSKTDCIVVELHDNIVEGCTESFKGSLKPFNYRQLSNSFNTIVELDDVVG